MESNKNPLPSSKSRSSSLLVAVAATLLLLSAGNAFVNDVSLWRGGGFNHNNDNDKGKLEEEQQQQQQQLELMRSRYVELLKGALTGQTEAFHDADATVPGFQSKEQERNEKHAVLKFSGHQRATNVQKVVERLLAEQVPGDFCECGTYLGGMSLFLAGLMISSSSPTSSGDDKQNNNHLQRKLWLADTFQGMPSNEGVWWKGQYDGSEIVVRNHFKNYGLWDENRVELVKGLFSETLPTVPIRQLAFLHVDCDTYSATMDVLENLYPKMSKGGWIVFDDYHAEDQQQKAVIDYMKKNKIPQSEVEAVQIPGYLTVGRWRVE